MDRQTEWTEQLASVVKVLTLANGVDASAGVSKSFGVSNNLLWGTSHLYPFFLSESSSDT